jgi:kynurenine formamidase
MRHSALQAASVEIGGHRFDYDAARPVSLALPLDFHGGDPRWFGAPEARSEPLVAGGFSGRVASGASCNASTLRLTPHCNGTHTECAGHLVIEPLAARDVVPPGLLAALLLDIEPEAGDREASRPAPQPGDLLFTRAALAAAWPGPLLAAGAVLPVAPRALVLRTTGTPGRATAAGRTPSAMPPYLSVPAAEFLVERGIEHLVVEPPSLDRLDDGGELAAHRVFFGLPPRSRALAEAARAHCTVTELARVPPTLHAGFGLLSLQVPALGGDAVPSRPLWHAVLAP